MKQIILTSILFLLALPLFSQSKTDSIRTIDGSFVRNGQTLSNRQLLDITITNKAAHDEMQTAKDNLDGGNVLGAIGGGLLGFPLGTALAGGKFNWYLAGAGAALILLEIPLFVAYKQHARNAVAIYNKGLKSTASTNFNLKLGLTCNGIGIKIRF